MKYCVGSIACGYCSIPRRGLCMRGSFGQVALPLASGLCAPKPALSDEQAQNPIDHAASDPEQTILPANGACICVGLGRVRTRRRMAKIAQANFRAARIPAQSRQCWKKSGVRSPHRKYEPVTAVWPVACIDPHESFQFRHPPEITKGSQETWGLLHPCGAFSSGRGGCRGASGPALQDQGQRGVSGGIASFASMP